MDFTFFNLLGLGFLMGVKHAFDADHIAAVSTLAYDKSLKNSSLLGLFWGFGHAISLALVGLIILLLKISIPEKISLSFEFIVGIMLVILGLNVLITINRNKIHFHKHKHGNLEHIHFHSHKIMKKHCHEHKSFFIGVIHGLAGSAALTLLVLTTINLIWIGLIYILIFGIGSMLGMMLISGLISLPFKLISKKFEKTQKFLSISAGLLSIFLGFTIIYKIGIMY